MSIDMMLGSFGMYNLLIWPMQVVAYLLCIAALVLAVVRIRYSNRIVAAILAFFWLWLGIVFWLRSASAFPPGYVFGALCIIQGVLFLVGVARPNVSFRMGTDVYSIVGILFIAYAMIGYPVLGYLVGHIYPQTVLVGIFPCPTTVFTLGLLLCTDGKVPKYLLIVPLLFSLSGFLWTYIGIVEDIGLIIAGFLGTPMIVYRDRKATEMEVAIA